MSKKTVLNDLIDFETYVKGKIIQSCVNIRTQERLPKTPATILYRLMENMDEQVLKEDLCKEIWGTSNYYIKRSFDVHLIKVKKLLVDTGYKIFVSRGSLCLSDTRR